VCDRLFYVTNLKIPISVSTKNRLSDHFLKMLISCTHFSSFASWMNKSEETVNYFLV